MGFSLLVISDVKGSNRACCVAGEVSVVMPESHAFSAIEEREFLIVRCDDGSVEEASELLLQDGIPPEARKSDRDEIARVAGLRREAVRGASERIVKARNEAAVAAVEQAHARARAPIQGRKVRQIGAAAANAAEAAIVHEIESQIAPDLSKLVDPVKYPKRLRHLDIDALQPTMTLKELLDAVREKTAP